MGAVGPYVYFRPMRPHWLGCVRYLKASAAARPIPVLPPVTKTTFPPNPPTVHSFLNASSREPSREWSNGSAGRGRGRPESLSFKDDPGFGESGNFQHDLATCMARFVQFLGASGFRKRQDGLDHLLQFPRIDQLRDFCQLRRIGLDEDIARPHAVLGGFFCRGRGDDGDKDSALLQHLPRALLGVPADGVERDIHVVDDILEACLFVIDGLIHAVRIQNALRTIASPLCLPCILRNLLPCETWSSLIPAIDSLRSLGIVWIPGLMAGMLLSGSRPIYAAIYQFVVLAMIFAASGLTSLISTLLIRTQAFTSAEQLSLRPDVARTGAL